MSFLHKFNLLFEDKILYDTDYLLATYNKIKSYESILWAKINDDVKVFFDNTPYNRDPITIQFKRHDYGGHNMENESIDKQIKSSTNMNNKEIQDGDAIWIIISPKTIANISGKKIEKIDKQGLSQYNNSDIYIKWDERHERMLLSYETHPPESKHFVFKYSKNTPMGFYILVYLNNSQKYKLIGTTHHDMRCSRNHLGPNYSTDDETDPSISILDKLCVTWDNDNGGEFDSFPLSDNLDKLSGPLLVINPSSISSDLGKFVDYNKDQWYKQFSNQYTTINWRDEIMDWHITTWSFTNPWTYYKIAMIIAVVAFIIMLVRLFFKF